MILRKRAEDLLSIAEKIETEFKNMDSITGGDVYIGCAESYLIKYLAKAVKNLNEKYDNIHYHITSGGTEQVIEKLERGILDMAFIVEPPELSRYNYIEIPEADKWGAYMLRDCQLAQKEYITVDDLLPYSVFCSEQSVKADLPRWAGEKAEKLNVIANFNLANNSFVFVREGLGLGLSFEKLSRLTKTLIWYSDRLNLRFTTKCV